MRREGGRGGGRRPVLCRRDRPPFPFAGSTGLSSNQKAHYNERSHCIHHFAELFGGLPLTPGTQKVDRATNFLGFH